MKNVYLLLLAVMFLVGCGTDDTPDPPLADTDSPSAPLNLSVSEISETSAKLVWAAATDNVGVTAYRVYKDGVISEASINALNITLNNLSTETAYQYHVTALDAVGNESNASNTATFSTLAAPLIFESNLSAMSVYAGNMSDLDPASGVQLYEISSTLFTDYATKQRLIRLPNGEKMSFDNSDLLPKFPDNTLIAKTFFYNINDQEPAQGKQIIETRILLKIQGEWQVGNYIWNTSQTDAVYSENGITTPISYIDIDGTTQNVNYMIPSKQDCFTCHNNNDVTFPIGMKLRNMNFTPSYVSQNQLAFFTTNGLLEGADPASISVLPDWTDASLDILQRGRAYIDINCAHCHQPGGPVVNFGLDFRLETIFEDSGIYANRGEIETRIQSNTPTYRMPQLGRTIVHEEAVTMLLEYLQEIED
ncbi:fibronectin type III domain-containing protein [Ulvibacter antarcticus]|uniref:Putative repeat protein (TIGR03806 family) n=1 Tax=Ulvibacter antarcticus TaxID=442714 RepID=A0A3L9YRT4_9FLAO|nr:hypothetical protein [Ulvibacter antarcticus]RMA57192.1 putative repeat protein (TIGR03806 family) [Ulvibacter antarcticus]